MLSWYFYANRDKSLDGQNTNPVYSLFSSLGGNSPTTDSNTNNSNGSTNTDQSSNGVEGNQPITKDRLYQLTDFAVAGATYFEDMRPLTVEEAPLRAGENPPIETPQATDGDVPLRGGVTPGTAVPAGNTPKNANKPLPPKFEIVPSLRYVERVTGHIYQMYIDTRASNKISNSTIPTIYEAIFDNTASSIIYRYLSEDSRTISTFFAKLGGEKGEFLPSNIVDVSLSPDKNSFFYLTKTSSGVSGTTRSFSETKRNQVFTSPYSEWLSQWVSPQKIYLTTKASGSVQGNIFSLNTTNGTMTKIFGGVLGLTTLANKDGSLVLYNASNAGTPSLGIFNVGTHSTLGIAASGLPEKCVWSTDNTTIYCGIPNSIEGLQPDNWYKGLTSFNDKFIKINASTGEISDIIDTNNFTPIDATHLFLDKNESVLYFINKKDSTLWGLDLN